MKDLAILFAGFLLALLATELARGERLQAALGRIFAIHGVGFVATLLVLDRIGPVAAAVFWTGMFFLWFGVRSHLESSILLQLLSFLRGGPASADEILPRYEQQYGALQRTEMLARARLLIRDGGVIAPTRRGRFIARAARFLQ